MTKKRLLWAAFKLIDKSENRIVLLKMLELLNRRFEARLIAGYCKNQIPINIAGYPVRYYDRHGRFPFKWIRAWFSQPRVIREVSDEFQPEILFVTHGTPSRMMEYCQKLAQKHGAKVVFDVRTLPTTDSNSPAFKVFEKRLRYACERYDGVTYITDEIRRYCVERYKLPNHRSAVWTSGVDADYFTPAVGESGASGRFRLLYHGGAISVSRGLDKLIQAIDLVRDLGVHLTLVGSLREPKAIEWIEKLNLQDCVSLVDTIPHKKIPQQIQACDAGILPFPDCDIWNTSSPIKLFEYMSCEKPVIVTDIPAHANVLKDSPFAFFCKNSTPSELAVGIRAAHAKKTDFKALGVLARKQVQKRHTWEIQAEGLGDFFDSVLEDK